MGEAPNLEKSSYFSLFSSRLSLSHRFLSAKGYIDKAGRPLESCCTQQREEGSTFWRCHLLIPLPMLGEYRVGSGQHQEGWKREFTPARADF